MSRHRDYNVHQVMTGALRPDMLELLVTRWQKERGLVPDGKAGPTTQGDLATALANIAIGMHGEKSAPLLEPLRLRALAQARRLIGRGEEGGNNAGPFLVRLRGLTGLEGRLWCAVAVCAYFELALVDGEQRPFRYSAHAKTLCENMIAAGGQVVTEPRPGDVLFWHRGPLKLDGGHTEICATGPEETATIAGNVGKYPATIHLRHYAGTTWRHRLHRIVRMPG